MHLGLPMNAHNTSSYELKSAGVYKSAKREGLMINTAKKTRNHTAARDGNLTEAEGGKRDLTLLPALYRSEIKMATDKDQIALMHTVMQSKHLGYCFVYYRLGFVMQYVGEGLMRCIQVANDERSLVWLSMYAETVHASGGMIQIAPYAVLVEPELFAEQNRAVLNEADQRIPFAREPRDATLSMEVA